MKILSVEQRFCDAAESWACWHNIDGNRPLFVIGKPYNGQDHNPGNGQMVAFLANSRESVRAAYEISLANGGSCEGAPGLRPHYDPNYYGAYFRDPDGNKLCVVCLDSA